MRAFLDGETLIVTDLNRGPAMQKHMLEPATQDFGVATSSPLARTRFLYELGH
jgi:hypothetical protein